MRREKSEIEIRYFQVLVSVVASLLAAVIVGFALIAVPIRLTLGLILEGDGFAQMLVVWALVSGAAFIWFLQGCVTNLANGRAWRGGNELPAEPPSSKEGALTRTWDEMDI